MMRSLTAQWMSTLYIGAISLALSVFIAQQVGPASFGEYSTALAIGAVLAIFIDGGMRNLLLREYTRVTPQLAHLLDRLTAIALGHALAVTLVLSLLAITLFWEHIAIALATIWCFFGVVLTQYFSAKLRGNGRLVMDAGWQMGQRSLSAACIALAIILGFDSPWHILAVWALCSITINLAFSQGLRCPTDRVLPTGIYKVALPLLWIDLATAIYFRSDMVLLQWFGIPQERIGQYAAAYRLIEAVILLTNPVAILLFRRMRCLNEDRRALCCDIPRSTVLAAVLGVAIASIMTFFAEFVIGLTYGSSYHEATGLLTILSWALPFVLPNAILTQAALALDIERQYALAVSAAAVCNVVLSCVFIVSYGPVAAAWATIVTEAVLFTALAYAVSKRVREPLFFNRESLLNQ